MQLYVNPEMDCERLFSECALVLKRGVCIDFFLSDSLADHIEQDAFLLSKLYQLRAFGASFYVKEDQEESLICQSDFEKTLIVRGVGIEEEYSVIESGFENKYYDFFEKTISSRSEFRLEPDDILLWCSIDQQMVMQYSNAVLRWESVGADHVELFGAEELSLNGERNIQVLEDTIITLCARNMNQVKMRSVLIRSIKKLEMSYYLQFYNKTAQRYEDLVDENNSGVYGIVRGSKLKLIWDVQSAEKVSITPFGIASLRGEYEFYVDDVLEININSKLQEESIGKRILIKEFPVPVFKHHFAEIEKRFVQNQLFVINDLQRQAFNFVADKGLLKQTFTEELLLKAESQEEALVDKAVGLGFEDFYERHSIPKLNLSIKKRLSAYFSDKPSISNLIKNMRSHYE